MTELYSERVVFKHIRWHEVFSLLYKDDAEMQEKRSVYENSKISQRYKQLRVGRYL